jgi:hypothetical protein
VTASPSWKGRRTPGLFSARSDERLPANHESSRRRQRGGGTGGSGVHVGVLGRRLLVGVLAAYTLASVT